MKIGIDAQTTLGQKTGFGFYVDNLTKALSKIAHHDQLELFYPNSTDDLSTPQRWLWDQVGLPTKARKAKIDLFHQPAFSAPIFYSGKKIVTIHDVISLFYTDIPFYSRQYYAKWMPFSYKFTDHIITVSEHSKRDIIEKLGIPAEKISVIYEAADERYAHPVSAEDLKRVKTKYYLHKPFVLNVGTLNPRKNLEFLVKVFSTIKQNTKLPHQLIIAGKKGWHYDQLFKLVKDLGMEDEIIFTGYIEDEDKPALYRLADLFVFPSMYEGFGLPPLEAMMCGTPIISSNTSSLPEVVGDGGITLSPTDKSGWVSAITHLLSNDNYRQELIGKGKTQAAKFSWELCAKETLDLYHQIGDVQKKEVR